MSINIFPKCLSGPDLTLYRLISNTPSLKHIEEGCNPDISPNISLNIEYKTIYPVDYSLYDSLDRNLLVNKLLNEK